MKTAYLLLACVSAGAALSGCGDNVGLLLRPVTLDRELVETVVQADRGLYGERIALLDVDGLIVNAETGGLFVRGENPVSLLAEQLDKAAGDGRVKAVVLRINSPGGTVQASEAMVDMVRRFRQRTGRPVIACITDVGASGGYYLACASQKIICQPSSITGSIGVVVQTVNFAGTMRMLGVTTEAVTSGKLKTMGSPLKPMTAEEREVFQKMVNEFYDAFVRAVDQSREGLSTERVRELADGRVYTGAQAIELGLVDRLGTVGDAIDEAKTATGIDRARVVMYHRPGGYRANVYSAADAPPAMTQINLVNLTADHLMLLGRPNFLYLWSTDLAPIGGD